MIPLAGFGKTDTTASCVLTSLIELGPEEHEVYSQNWLEVECDEFNPVPT